MERRVGGIIFVKIDGDLKQAKGEFTYNLGKPKREMVVGVDSVHGYTEKPQPGMLEGAITDSRDLSLAEIVGIKDATVTCELANGKVIVFRESTYTADGNTTTNEGEIEFKIESITAKEIRSA